MALLVKASPHLKVSHTTSWIMFQVIAALIPAVIGSWYFFRIRAVVVITLCVLSCVLAELMVTKLRGQASTIHDGSSILTGLLLAMTLPPSTTWYAAIIGSLFAIVVVKQIFGGLGNNIFNPALGARAFLAAAYPAMLTTWIEPFSLDSVSTATPLALRKFDHIFTEILPLFQGNVAGCLGETSAALLLLGGVYLLVMKIIDYRIPLTMFGTVAVIASVFYKINPDNGTVLFHFFSGGFMMGTFFMATDPVTTPVTKTGRFIFGLGCGILIMVIRYFSGLPEGVMYAILFMNALVPLINRVTKPLSFGSKKVMGRIVR